MNLIDIVHHIVQQSIQAAQLTDYCMGTVVKSSPLEISINPQMAPIRESVMVRTESIANTTFQVGDKLILLKVQRGQKFIILGKAS